MCLQSLATIPLQEEDWFYLRCQHTFELVHVPVDALLMAQVQDLRDPLIAEDLPEGPHTAVEVQVDDDSAQVEYDRFYHNGDKGTQSFGNEKPSGRSVQGRICDRMPGCKQGLSNIWA